MISVYVELVLYVPKASSVLGRDTVYFGKCLLVIQRNALFFLFVVVFNNARSNPERLQPDTL